MKNIDKKKGETESPLGLKKGEFHLEARLLALNALFEAARTGNRGKELALMAEEMKKRV